MGNVSNNSCDCAGLTCAESITIYDTKGRPERGTRTHTVPIIKAAVRGLQAFERAGNHVFSMTKGVKPISGTTLSGWGV